MARSRGARAAKAGRRTLRACAVEEIGTRPSPDRLPGRASTEDARLGSGTLSFPSERKSRPSRGEWGAGVESALEVETVRSRGANTSRKRHSLAPIEPPIAPAR